MTCTFAKDFIAKNAKAFFRDEALRKELTQHMLACPDCAEHIKTAALAALDNMHKADPKEMQPVLERVIEVAEEDMAKWKQVIRAMDA
jgi:hypothetical protein